MPQALVEILAYKDIVLVLKLPSMLDYQGSLFLQFLGLDTQIISESQ